MQAREAQCRTARRSGRRARDPSSVRCRTLPAPRIGQTPRMRNRLTEPVFALRPATPADAEFCYRLHKAAMGELHHGDLGVGRAGPARVSRARLQPAPMADHHRRGRPMSACWMSTTVPGEIYLSRIEIHPGHQGHGIGTRLISALHRRSTAQGPGPGSRRAHGQPPRAGALPAARPDRSGQARRPRHQDHHAVRPAPGVEQAGAPVRAGSTIFKPQWSPALCLAHVGRRQASHGLAGACSHPRGISMTIYMYQASYTAKSMAAQLHEPQDPVETIRPPWRTWEPRSW